MGTQLVPQKGDRANFRPMFIVAKPLDGLKCATWYGGRPRPRPHCARWGSSSPPKRGHSPSNVRPCLLWPNGSMDQDMPIGTKVGLDPSDIVLDGDPAPPPQKGGNFLGKAPIFGPCLLWPNYWMDQDATWYGGRPRPKRHCARWGPSSPYPKKVHSPQFSVHVYCGQTAAWIKTSLGMEVGLVPGHIMMDGDPTPPPQKGKTAPNFRPMFVVAKRLDGSRCHLVRW